MCISNFGTHVFMLRRAPRVFRELAMLVLRLGASEFGFGIGELTDQPLRATRRRHSSLSKWVPTSECPRFGQINLFSWSPKWDTRHSFGAGDAGGVPEAPEARGGGIWGCHEGWNQKESPGKPGRPSLQTPKPQLVPFLSEWKLTRGSWKTASFWGRAPGTHFHDWKEGKHGFMKLLDCLPEQGAAQRQIGMRQHRRTPNTFGFPSKLKRAHIKRIGRFV